MFAGGTGGLARPRGTASGTLLPELDAICCDKMALGPLQLKPPLKPRNSLRKGSFFSVSL